MQFKCRVFALFDYFHSFIQMLLYVRFRKCSHVSRPFFQSFHFRFENTWRWEFTIAFYFTHYLNHKKINCSLCDSWRVIALKLILSHILSCAHAYIIVVQFFKWLSMSFPYSIREEQKKAFPKIIEIRHPFILSCFNPVCHQYGKYFF